MKSVILSAIPESYDFNNSKCNSVVVKKRKRKVNQPNITNSIYLLILFYSTLFYTIQNTQFVLVAKQLKRRPNEHLFQ